MIWMLWLGAASASSFIQSTVPPGLDQGLDNNAPLVTSVVSFVAQPDIRDGGRFHV